MRLAEAPAGGAACSSISVFHAPQSSQRPDHLGCATPQDWQTKARAPRANSRPLARRLHRASPPDLHLDGAFGRAVDELVDEGIAAVIDVLRRPIPDDLALVEHGDAVGDLARAGDVMGDGNGGDAEGAHRRREET